MRHRPRESAASTPDTAITSAAWESTAAHLAEYAYGIMRGWIYTGAIVGQVRNATGIGIRWEPGLHDLDTAEELAGITIAVALDRFHRILAGNQWDPARGARMETFFIRQCLLQFPNEYRRWLREHHAGHIGHWIGMDHIENLKETSPHCDPEFSALCRVEAEKALIDLPGTRLRVIVVLVSLGYSHEEIAGFLEITPKAVQMTLYRMRVSQRTLTAS
ncbi:hypothetical protein ACIP5Y_07115 [Nocardia sp. NPDC088792]|uniref:hypothetical protein n=1 Tax=Nocardia sp. NPDC088792 TaxID=3364332 RepID=UPI00382EFA85